jgi:hypothetical protein
VTTIYRRRLSREDADTGTILITKDRWRMFPPPLEEFAVEVGGQRFLTTIVAKDCACVGEPHRHDHLEAGPFRHLIEFAPGRWVAIERTNAGTACLRRAPVPDEAEGLRAFAVRVEAYAGVSCPEEPRRVEVDGQMVKVERVLARWREENRLGFRVTLRDGSEFLLYYVPEFDLWSAAPLGAGKRDAPEEWSPPPYQRR